MKYIRIDLLDRQRDPYAHEMCTVRKRLLRNHLQTVRQRDAHQAAALERVRVHRRHGRGHDIVHTGAAVRIGQQAGMIRAHEHATRNGKGRVSVRNLDRAQACAAGKGTLTDLGHRSWNAHTGQAVAIEESARTDRRHALRDRHFPQVDTAGKGRITNRGHAVRDRHALQRSAVHGHTGRDVRNAVRKGDGSDAAAGKSG